MLLEGFVSHVRRKTRSSQRLYPWLVPHPVPTIRAPGAALTIGQQPVSLGGSYYQPHFGENPEKRPSSDLPARQQFIDLLAFMGRCGIDPGQAVAALSKGA